MPVLRYAPVPESAVQPSTVPPLPAGVLTYGMLDDRLRQLDTALALANARLATVACLAGAEPDTDRARACLDSLVAFVRSLSPLVR